MEYLYTNDYFRLRKNIWDFIFIFVIANLCIISLAGYPETGLFGIKSHRISQLNIELDIW